MPEICRWAFMFAQPMHELCNMASARLYTFELINYKLSIVMSKSFLQAVAVARNISVR